MPGKAILSSGPKSASDRMPGRSQFSTSAQALNRNRPPPPPGLRRVLGL